MLPIANFAAAESNFAMGGVMTMRAAAYTNADMGGTKLRLKVYPNDEPEEAAKKSAKAFKDKEKEKKSKDDKPLPEYPVYKYSRPFLHEAIILGGIPAFISYGPKFDKILQFENIIEPSSRILRPPNREDYPYTPYEFKDELELEEYLRRAKSETIDTLYQRAKAIVRKYTDQDDHKVNLLAIDILWSYFQDKFGSTHYIIVTGTNEGGKSSIGDTFGSIAYRTCNMTNPSAANIFRALGMIEAGQCTLVLDEAERINDDDILAILKSGYSNKKTPKTNTNSWRLEWFHSYCLKIIIAEKSPDKLKAKGLTDRSLHVASFPGDTPLDIKEVTNENEKSRRLKKALAELIDLRKLMLIYRIVHFEDTIPDLDVGVRRRAKELCKPYIRLFYGSESQGEVEQTFQKFLEARNTKKSVSLEPILLPIILQLTEEMGTSVPSIDVWDYILSHSNAKPSVDKPGAYYIADYTIYKNTITKLLEDMFGAHPKHAKGGNVTVFDTDKLRKLRKFYDTQIFIKTRPIEDKDEDEADEDDKEKANEEGEGEGSECGEGIWGETPPTNDGKTIENFDDGNGKAEDISKNRGSEGIPIPPHLSQEPSQPSHPSPNHVEVSDEDKAAMLKEYDRLHKRSLKSRDAASRIGKGQNQNQAMEESPVCDIRECNNKSVGKSGRWPYCNEHLPFMKEKHRLAKETVNAVFSKYLDQQAGEWVLKEESE
jgi:hypothetical protein